jgi:hypothetical protein
MAEQLMIFRSVLFLKTDNGANSLKLTGVSEEFQNLKIIVLKIIVINTVTCRQ